MLSIIHMVTPQVSLDISSMFCCVAAIVAVASTVTLLYKKYQSPPATKDGLPLPPGPPASFFWEVALPTSNIAKTLTKWVAEYGPVVSVRAGRQVVVIVGNVEAAAELMEKEGAALVDRPRSIAAGEIISQGMRLILASYDERCRRLHKAAHTHLRPKAAEAYRDMQAENARNMILGIHADPTNPIQHVERYAVAVILRVMYGKPSSTSNLDPTVVRIQKVTKNVQSAMQPGAFLVERIPVLKHVPGYGRTLKQYHESELMLFREQLASVRDEVSSDETQPSFGGTLLKTVDAHQLSEDEMAYLAGSLFSAGSDTTSGVITALIMAAAKYPEAQARVHDQLDTVIGRDKMPSFDDWDQLPELHAFIAEGMRWRPVVAIGIPHRAAEDIIWRGHCIPAGATVFGCQWAISRDPIVFPDPEKFDPQRWLDKNGRLCTDVRSYPFGFGRRVCPGQHIASQSVFIDLALLLWCFQIKERPEAPIDTDAFDESVTLHWHPFEVEFVPRLHATTLREVMEDVHSI